MIILFLIFISGFIKITADIIRVPLIMQDSWWKRYIGNKYIDPQISWVNKGDYHIILYPILSMFGDLWHTLYSIFIAIYIVCIWLAFKGWMIDTTPIWFGFYCFLFHGIGVWGGHSLWRKLLN
jgi:hypothetical protein